ncbi:hypothetical protein KSP35_21920 [Aquihabitans sp. G128]|uniref:transglutaminase family protein n=1 Tax=Aquihabitans sp. G128 TaxID=2849779 RepID=UPI001C21484A|nr:hypothetical protein KSP35_21920 [Aquihabitans sp. G128]
MAPAIMAATGIELAVAGQAAVSHRGGDPGVGLLAGVVVAALVVFGLQSVSIRLASRLLVVVGGALLVRFGAFDGTVASGSQAVLVWVVASVAVFVLTDRLATGAQPALLPPGSTAADPGGPAAPAPGRQAAAPTGWASPVTGQGRARPASTARTFVLVGATVVVFAVLLTPIALPHLADATKPGDGPRLDRSDTAGASLRATDSLDMTRRPELSDEVLFTVDADRATFWRGETFDRWDGRRWTRSEPSRMALDGSGDVEAFPGDLGASGEESFTQTFRIEADYSDIVFAAPSAVRVDATGPLAQRADGTLTTVGPALGQGATYKVQSRRPALTEERLRNVRGDVPAAILQQYAEAPITSERVRQAAKDAVGDATTTYDKVVALERWMGARTEYSLDAPLSPEGVDVVDHFLFTSKEGWCEQIASSLVVLARADGLPARLVTGFVPEDRDRVTGSYQVRGRDAHAWAEVWFPEVGWVPFDPTADVPLAGTSQTGSTWTEWLADHALYLLLGVAVVAAVAGPAYVLGRRWLRRRARRPVGWPATADARLDALGARVGRARAPSETGLAYARALALRYRDPRLVAVGHVLDDALYAPRPPGPDRVEDADATLAELLAADVPDPVPEPAAEPVA